MFSAENLMELTADQSPAKKVQFSHDSGVINNSIIIKILIINGDHSFQVGSTTGKEG